MKFTCKAEVESQRAVCLAVFGSVSLTASSHAIYRKTK